MILISEVAMQSLRVKLNKEFKAIIERKFSKKSDKNLKKSSKIFERYKGLSGVRKFMTSWLLFLSSEDRIFCLSYL